MIEKIGPYAFDTDPLNKIMEDIPSGRVLIQLPEGLRPYTDIITDILPDDTEVDIWGGTCFGACDVPSHEGYDLVLQLGHNIMPSVEIEGPYLFLPLHAPMPDVEKLAEALNDAFPDGIPELTLVSPSTFTVYLNDLSNELNTRGMSTRLGTPSPRSLEQGQVLGCDAGRSMIETSAVLYIGDGDFHPLGVALANPDKVVLAYRPSTGGMDNISEHTEALIRRRYGVIVKASDAKDICVITSTKPGQLRLDDANDALDRIRGSGRRATLMLVDTLDIDSLRDWSYDAYVLAMCPRVAIDDAERFHVPALTITELDMMLTGTGVEDYRFDTLE